MSSNGCTTAGGVWGVWYPRVAKAASAEPPQPDSEEGVQLSDMQHYAQPDGSHSQQQHCQPLSYSNTDRSSPQYSRASDDLQSEPSLSCLSEDYSASLGSSPVSVLQHIHHALSLGTPTRKGPVVPQPSAKGVPQPSAVLHEFKAPPQHPRELQVLGFLPAVVQSFGLCLCPTWPQSLHTPVWCPPAQQQQITPLHQTLMTRHMCRHQHTRARTYTHMHMHTHTHTYTQARTRLHVRTHTHNTHTFTCVTCILHAGNIHLVQKTKKLKP